MAGEVDSFITKFKSLCKAGRNANLNIEVNAGKAQVTLCVLDLEVLQGPLPPKRSRNGPAQQRRRERRAANRKLAEEASVEAQITSDVEKEAEKAVTEEVIVPDATVTNSPNEMSAKGATGKVGDIVDEFCPNKDYNQSKIVSKSNLYHVMGEYRNPTFRPWSKVNPEEENKKLWEAIKKDNIEKGIIEIGDGSTCFEHWYEFWGTWKVNPEIDEEFLSDNKNWPKGVKIVEVKPK